MSRAAKPQPVYPADLMLGRLDRMDGIRYTQVHTEIPRLRPEDEPPAPILAADVVQSYPQPRQKMRTTAGEWAFMGLGALGLLALVVVR